MFKRNNLYLYITVLLIGMLLFSSLVVFASTDNVKDSRLSTSAYSAALYVPETQSFLYLKNADKKLPMASTTKIMTALITLEQCKLTDEVIICKDAVGVEGSSAYLKEGESFTVEQLLYALLLQSANDAAVALAYQVSGSVEDFAYLMTERAESIGATNTRFSNPHGLDCEDHYTTARDLALIAAEAMKNEEFVKISSTVKKSFGRDEICRTFINHNKLLRRYDGCIGVKTGFTKKSGRCLVSAA
jgi:D-alanyl-D-alanine carboxypeptidase